MSSNEQMLQVRRLQVELAEARADAGAEAKSLRRNWYAAEEDARALRNRAEAAEAQVAAVRALFAGGPDTSCRTTWTDGIECVEVPIEDLRAALSSSEPVNAGPDVERFGTIGGVEFYTDKPEPVGDDGLTDAERRELAAEWRAQHERLPIATEGDET